MAELHGQAHAAAVSGVEASVGRNRLRGAPGCIRPDEVRHAIGKPRHELPDKSTDDSAE